MNADAHLIEHMMNPKNYGKLETANAQGVGKNPENGEKVAIFLKVIEKDNEPFIEDISFLAIGCTTTIVAGSIITSEARNIGFARAEELIAITLGMLDNVPPEEAACSEMVAVALKASMDTYLERQKDANFPTISYHISKSCEIKEDEAQ
ncbi:MAG: nitrogen fixation protein NifU [Sulfurovum sp. FS06-10]|jgi:nitrogen fixation NifU-like protein|nr:MAG: nitrogen fixation protein NifU [Sulfurovum sp. FS06-10]